MEPERNNLELEGFWGCLQQQQDLLRESWEEYFEALKSLEKEKKEIHRTKKEAFKAAEDIRGKILRVNAECFSLDHFKFSGRRREAVPNKTELSTLKSMKCALENLSSKEESSLGTETECADERVTGDKVVFDDRCRAETCMDTSENGKASEETISEELRDTMFMQRLVKNQWHDAIEDYNLELEILTDAYETEHRRLKDKIEAVDKFKEFYESEDTGNFELDPEIQCLKGYFADLIHSRFYLLHKVRLLTEEKYKIDKEKLSLKNRTSILNEHYSLASSRVRLAKSKS